MEILNNNFLIYGMGDCGKSAVLFLKQRGANNIYVYDDIELNEQYENRINQFKDIVSLDISYVILSPGVQIIGNKNIELLKKNKIPYISEFGLGFLFVKGKTICITGTNGKTTTVNIIKDILQKSKKEVFLCGNTVQPITKIANITSKDSYVVCEVSSFALESCEIKPYISSILNITDDHLIRHITFDNYKNTKLKIVKDQDENDFFVCNGKNYYSTKAKKEYYSLYEKTDGAYVLDGYIYLHNKKLIDIKKIKLFGDKNLENIMCAMVVANILKIKKRYIKSAVLNFKPISHRMELFATIKGVSYIDDSKATNVDSTICALDSFKCKTILLLGGSDKGYSFEKIFKHTNNTKKIICFGATKDKIYDTALQCGIENVLKVDKFVDAVYYAMSYATEGDYVLLSPSCASFDEFNSYKERGDLFKKLVLENE